MGVPKTPSYGKQWKAKRQTRIKPSGMTKMLEKYDTLWKNYDPQTFIREVMGKGDNGLRDIQRNIDGFKKAETEISDLSKANDKNYNKDEKDIIKKVLADIDEELTFWKTKKKAFVLEEGGAKMALDKLQKIATSLDAAMDKTETRAKQLAAAHAKLSEADKYNDRRHPPALIETFRKSADDFETLLTEADAIDRKLEAADGKVMSAYGDNNSVEPEIDKLELARKATHKRLKELWGDRAVWRLWADKQIAASPV